MAKLVKATFVKDPDRRRTVLLLPGEEPEPRLAALVTNPDAWEDGKLPEAAQHAADTDTGDDSPQADDSNADADQETPKKAAPAAKKTAAKKTAASSRSRGRDAAGEGDSGE